MAKTDTEKLKEEIEMLTSIAFNNQNAYNWVERTLKKAGHTNIDADSIARAIEPAAAEAILKLIEENE